MSLEPPAYILSLQNNIRARPISWEGAVRAKTITEADLKKIKAVDKVRKEQRKQAIAGNVQTYVTLLLGDGEAKGIFESAARRTDILQYMLVLTGDLIEDSPQLAKVMVQHPHPYKPLLPLLKQSNNAEDPIPMLTSTVLSSLLSQGLIAQPKSTEDINEALPQLYSYLATLSNTSDSNLRDIAVQEYSTVLQTSKSRQQFWKQKKETLDPLFAELRSAVGNKDVDILTANGGNLRGVAEGSRLGGGVSLQLFYHILLVIWQLSFEAQLVGSGLDDDYNIVALYTRLLSISPKEKTTRLLLATLHNLLSANKGALMPATLPAKLPSTLSHLKTRNFTDEDLLDDLKKLVQMTDEYASSQTTLEEYAAEVHSGHLRWSPPHRNADFWRDNAREIIETENGKLCKELVAIMDKDWASDKQVLAIACNDLAYLVKECPEKRRVLEKFGLKAKVMSLMQDENETVRWESLRAVGEWLRYSFDG
ncbi:vacuolar ATP synthase-like protein subunit H [Piedraia hortae CBS 480.64]|uniref:V-type proton ATPase subunit H n=1 Tax=Piedraia hortae CBS 480.64 TaxID=1314780 RepID=A0A6A7C830_9PEZI|nr:vacuolar ATP synthase-like protein subunit H [Piedraia hortae CBS 480.64]